MKQTDTYTFETYQFKEHIRQNRIHSINFQPVQVFPVIVVIDQVKKQSHKQKTDTTAE